MTDLAIIENSLADIMKRSEEIPFGNSKYQIDDLVAREQTPERAYRHLLLNFHKRFKDLKVCSIVRRKAQNKVKQLQRELTNSKDELQQEAILLEIELTTCEWEHEDKLARDCVEELKYMKSLIEALPSISREEFENAEESHFMQRDNQPNRALVENLKTCKYLTEGK